MLVYKITNTINGKCYIGITEKTLEERFSQHLSKYRNNSHRSLYNAMHKYGLDNFVVEVVEDNIMSYSELLEKEMYYIKLYDSYNNGYNMTTGGEINPMDCDMTKNKHDNIMRSKETRTKISNTMKQKAREGALFSEEHRKHLSDSAKNIIYFCKEGKMTHIKQDEIEKMNELIEDGWIRYIKKKDKNIISTCGESSFATRSIQVYCVLDNGDRFDFPSILDAGLWWYNNYKPFGETYSSATYKRKILKSIEGKPIEFSLSSKKDYKIITNIKWYRGGDVNE